MRKSKWAIENGRRWANKNYKKNREKLIIGMKERHQKIRFAVMDILGGRFCKKCGFSDIRALQIDHKNGGGKKELNSMSWNKYLRFVIENLERYQILCANCNWIKRVEEKELYK